MKQKLLEMFNKKFLLALISVLSICDYVICDLNMTSYYEMPPLYKMDDYDRCMEEFPNEPATYCYVTSVIKPNDSSTLWHTIDSFSANHKHHFRHDHLKRGICMRPCKEQFKHFVPIAKQKYLVSPFKPNSSEIRHYEPNTIRNALFYRGKYHKIINICVNWDLKHNYELMAYSEILYCVSNTKNTFERDSFDILFSLIFCLLIKIIISSTLYDFYLKRNQQGGNKSDHYRTPVVGSYSSLMVSFSIPRNWSRLVQGPTTQLAEDLKSIHAIRFFTMYCVIIGHCAFFINIMPAYNPQYMEKNYYRIITMLLINGTIVIQTFFALSGYLLSIQFAKMKQQYRFNVNFLWKSILYRYFRLTPVYIFLIFYHATWFVTIQDGPLWPHVTETERTFCRNNWWSNVLYVNNIFTSSEPCFQHSWYLAADFQMFVIGVILQIIIWKFPKCTNWLLGVMLAISCIIPGLITYFNKFEGIFVTEPENQRYAQWYDPMYQKMYIPSYTNFGSFLFGMIGGILYTKYKKENTDLKQSKTLNTVWYSAIPTVLLILMSGFIFYNYELKKPSFWISVYSSLVKNLWGFLTAVFITGIAFRVGWVLKDIFCYSAFRPLGRLTYCAYLIHPTLIRITLGNLRQPQYISDMGLLTLVFSILLQSYIVAFVLCIGIEFPISSILRNLFNKDIIPNKTLQNKRDEINHITQVELVKDDN